MDLDVGNIDGRMLALKTVWPALPGLALRGVTLQQHCRRDQTAAQGPPLLSNTSCERSSDHSQQQQQRRACAHWPHAQQQQSTHAQQWPHGSSSSTCKLGISELFCVLSSSGCALQLQTQIWAAVMLLVWALGEVGYFQQQASLAGRDPADSAQWVMFA
jgi:hypothetical protein